MEFPKAATTKHLLKRAQDSLKKTNEREVLGSYNYQHHSQLFGAVGEAAPLYSSHNVRKDGKIRSSKASVYFWVGEHSESIQPYATALIPFIILKVTSANQRSA